MDVPSAFKDLSTKLGDITPKLNGCNDPSCTSGVISSLVPIINSQTSALDNAPCGAGNTTAPALVAQVIGVSFREFSGLHPLRSRTVIRTSSPLSNRTRTSATVTAVLIRTRTRTTPRSMIRSRNSWARPSARALELYPPPPLRRFCVHRSSALRLTPLQARQFEIRYEGPKPLLDPQSLWCQLSIILARNPYP